MPGYPTNKQQLNAALRSHLQFVFVFVFVSESAALGEVSDRN